MKNSTGLAINGGPKVRVAPWPERSLIGPQEKDAVNALFDEAIRTGRAFGYNGPQEEAYCREFAASMGGGWSDAVNSGSSALYAALKALRIEPFSEVVVSCITDPGGMMPIPLLNCIPMVADAAPGSYNIGPAQVEELLSPRTSAIVVAHIGGEPADIEGIMRIARDRGIPVVEDCAQAQRAEMKGKALGAFGAFGIFSTMFGKHHCTGGQGGIVFTRDESFYWECRRASDRGKPFGPGQPVHGGTNVVASLNLNLSDLAAAIGRVQLAKLPGIVDRRRHVVEQIAKGLSGCEAIRVPDLLPGARPSWWFWRLEVNLERIRCDKQTFCAALQAEGLPIDVTYRALPHTAEWFTKRSVFGTSGLPWTSAEYRGDASRPFPCPNAMRSLERQFNLSIHEGWGPKEIEDSVAIIRKVGDVYLR
jgi:perosamine synthetase